MGNGISTEDGRSNRRHKKTKRPPRAVPSAYIPPPEKHYIVNHLNGDVIKTSPPVNDIEKPVIQPETPEKNDNKSDLPKTNGYVKNSKHKKTKSEHTIQREKAYKLYDPEDEVYREKSYILRNEAGPKIVSGRPRSFIAYEPRQSRYVVRETVREPRRAAHIYGTLRPESAVRPVRIPIRPKSDIVTQPQTVRIVRAVPGQTPRTIRSRSAEPRQVIVRRSVTPERMYTTSNHGYIPRHTLGRYKPKVIDGYVAPNNQGEKVLIDSYFSEPGGYREVIVEPTYQTIRTVPPPPYEGVMYEKNKQVQVEKNGSIQRPTNVENDIKHQSTKTDDEKLKDIPKTQYFDDGNTIMIIDYLVEPYIKLRKEPQSTSTPRYENQNIDVSVQNGHEDPYHTLNDSDHRQRQEEVVDVNFLP